MEAASCGMWGVRRGSIGKICNFLLARLCGPAYLAAGPFIMGCSRQVFLFDTKKEPKKCPLLPIAREARLRGCSPLRTPIMWSEDGKAKKRRSAAFFLTLFRPLPFDPSGAKFHSTTHSVGADARHRPAPGRCSFTETVGGGVLDAPEALRYRYPLPPKLFLPLFSLWQLLIHGVKQPHQKLFVVHFFYQQHFFGTLIG